MSAFKFLQNMICKYHTQEFYKKKERRAITRPQYLQETFEQCAEEMNKRLKQYKSQTLDYHNCCLQGKSSLRK